MNRVELGDSLELIKTLESESVHLILSDIVKFYAGSYEKMYS